ncbi:MAG: adenine deaminase [Pirellulaceae bacterium]|nr:adenine deaminase [Pirellulaceae bacterium]
MDIKRIVANIVDADRQTIVPREVIVDAGTIVDIRATSQASSTFLIPGFVDAHVHVESSMLVPAEFARAAVVHGTIGSVSDPHEIGNVLGVAGVEFMLLNAATVPFKFCFGAPSCVPATTYETAGAEITVAEVRALLRDPRIGYLSEVMNFPGVLRGDPDMLAKIAAALELGKPVDGHAPGLRGKQAKDYFAAGISTDHECFSKPEALDKLAVGCKIAIREGSAARNFQELYELINDFPNDVMFCSDDKHPDELILGHINHLASRAVQGGMDLFKVIRAASLNAIEHYQLPIGRLRIGDPADFVELVDLTNFLAHRVFINGQLVAERGQSLIKTSQVQPINRFEARWCTLDSLAVAAATNNMVVIRALDGQLITQRATVPVVKQAGQAMSDPDSDVLKLVVLNRYREARPAVAFIQGFGLKRGALASSVAHDSHNIIAVGVDDHSICQAINRVISMQGGLAVSHGDAMLDLPLPVAGLMSTEPIEWVSQRYCLLDAEVRKMGSQLRAPFMTLSFMALLVIPELKLSDQGLFDGQLFQFTNTFV